MVGGNGAGDSDRLPPLSYAEADAEALAAVLLRQEASVTPLVGATATRGAVEAAVDDVLTKATGEDMLAFAFAAHGHQFRPPGGAEDVPFLCTPDCTAAAAAPQVRLNDPLERAGDAKVGKALFPPDACRTDPGTRDGVTGNAVNLKAQTVRLSAAANKPEARRHPDLGHGLSVGEVIDALGGKAKKDGGGLTGAALVDRVTNGVEKRSRKPFPALDDGRHQTPHQLGSLAGRGCWRRKRRPRCGRGRRTTQPGTDQATASA